MLETKLKWNNNMKPIGQEPNTPSTSCVVSFFHTWVLEKPATTHHTTQLINKDTSFIKESTKLSRHELSTKLSTLYSTCSKRTHQQKNSDAWDLQHKKVKNKLNWPAFTFKRASESSGLEGRRSGSFFTSTNGLKTMPLIGCVDAQTENEIWDRREVLKLRFEIR